MSALGRLWKRAPVWRLCLISGIAFTGLAAMFPPPIPRWLPTHTVNVNPHFVSQPDAAPPDYSQTELLPPGHDRSGVIPFSGHRLPLPAGTWQNIVLAQDGGAASVQVVLLARVEDQRLTGLELAAAPSPLSGSVAAPGALSPCYAPNAVVHQNSQVEGANPLAHECWGLSSSGMGSDAALVKDDTVLQHGLDRLQKMGVTMPGHMIVLNYLRSDETGWCQVLLMLPDRHDESNRKLQAWARRFVPLLHKGYESTLTAADLAAIGRDPA